MISLADRAQIAATHLLLQFSHALFTLLLRFFGPAAEAGVGALGPACDMDCDMG